MGPHELIRVTFATKTSPAAYCCPPFKKDSCSIHRFQKCCAKLGQ